VLISSRDAISLRGFRAIPYHHSVAVRTPRVWRMAFSPATSDGIERESNQNFARFLLAVGAERLK